KKKRQVYDQYGSAAFDQASQGGAPGGGFGGFGGFDVGQGFQGDFGDLGDLGDVLGEMFGMGGGRHKQTRGKDIEVDVQLEFKEAAFGVRRVIKLYKPSVCTHCKGEGAEPGTKVSACSTCNGKGQVHQMQRTMFGTIQTATPCPTCHGRGKTWSEACHECKGAGIVRREETIEIDIPAGMSAGEILKVEAQGEATANGGRPGDLYLRMQVKSDSHFTREGNDVISHVSVPFSTLVLGGSIEVETLEGKTTLKIPEGTNPGTVFTLRGEGIPFLRSRGRGNHLIRVTADTPKRLSREQKQAMEELKKLGL
ncbi:MAG: DnaJ C-terminal domain-containing protein, partial [Patescibacteria group bacterium]